ncbi:hypothetical protein [Microcoleus sp. F4-D5]|uniref:hypothetical protein n=1 Tax=Microcoleus sp. F4-D5 TaxID=2818760 RepID=UPI002FD02C80
MNQRRVEVMSKCHHTRISRGITIIIDDSVSPESVANLLPEWEGNPSDKSAKQKGIVTVISYLYDAIRYKIISKNALIYQKNMSNSINNIKKP